MHRSRSHMQTLIICKPDLNWNYCTSALILLVKIVLCSKFYWTKFIDPRYFHVRSWTPEPLPTFYHARLLERVARVESVVWTVLTFGIPEAPREVDFWQRLSGLWHGMDWLLPRPKPSTLISQNEFIKWFYKVNFPTKSSTHCYYY